MAYDVDVEEGGAGGGLVAGEVGSGHAVDPATCPASARSGGGVAVDAGAELRGLGRWRRGKSENFEIRAASCLSVLACDVCLRVSRVRAPLALPLWPSRPSLLRAVSTVPFPPAPAAAKDVVSGLDDYYLCTGYSGCAKRRLRATPATGETTARCTGGCTPATTARTTSPTG